MIQMVSSDCQFIIEFNRRPSFIKNSDFRYICKIRFKTILGSPITELTLHENHIIQILSLIYEYIEMGATNLSTSFNIDGNLNLDSICIIREYPIDLNNPEQKRPKDYLQIQRYNTVEETLITLITIELEYNELVEFCCNLYDEFIADLEEGAYYSPNFLY